MRALSLEKTGSRISFGPPQAVAKTSERSKGSRAAQPREPVHREPASETLPPPGQPALDAACDMAASVASARVFMADVRSFHLAAQLARHQIADRAPRVLPVV